MKQSILVTLLALSLIACSKKTEKAPDNQSDKKELHKETPKSFEAPALNNGERWKVNEEMMPAIVSMEASINATESNTPRDYAALAKALNKDIERLTSQCTMKGQSHEELHKWLLSYIDAVKQLGNAKTPEEQEAAFQKVKAEFDSFYVYFE